MGIRIGRGAVRTSVSGLIRAPCERVRATLQWMPRRNREAALLALALPVLAASCIGGHEPSRVLHVVARRDGTQVLVLAVLPSPSSFTSSRKELRLYDGDMHLLDRHELSSEATRINAWTDASIALETSAARSITGMLGAYRLVATSGPSSERADCVVGPGEGF